MPIQILHRQRPPAEQILNILGGFSEEMQRRKQAKLKEFSAQMQLYKELRDAGYSPDEAHSRLKRVYGQTSFLEKVMGDAVGGPPRGENLDVEEQKAKIELTKARIKQIQSEDRSKFIFTQPNAVDQTSETDDQSAETGPTEEEKATANMKKANQYLRLLNMRQKRMENVRKSKQADDPILQQLNGMIQQMEPMQDVQEIPKQESLPVSSPSRKRKKGDRVTYQGKSYIVGGYDESGKLQLDPE